MRLNDSYPTEFYVSDVGYLAIKQDCPECDRLSTFLLSPEQTKIFFNLLPDLMRQQNECWTGLYMPSDDGDSDV